MDILRERSHAAIKKIKQHLLNTGHASPILDIVNYITALENQNSTMQYLLWNPDPKPDLLPAGPYSFPVAVVPQKTIPPGGNFSDYPETSPITEKPKE